MYSISKVFAFKLISNDFGTKIKMNHVVYIYIMFTFLLIDFIHLMFRTKPNYVVVQKHQLIGIFLGVSLFTDALNKLCDFRIPCTSFLLLQDWFL